VSWPNPTLAFALRAKGPRQKLGKQMEAHKRGKLMVIKRV